MLVVLVGPRPGSPPAPETTPVGRAALRVAAEGIPVAFTADGNAFLAARPGGWAPVQPDRVVAVLDRYPSQTWPDRHRQALAALGDVPVGNPLALTLLYRDKLATQAWLAPWVGMPAVEADPDRFAAALAAWGEGFLKPRYGALGRGIRRVRPGDPLPAQVPGAVAGRPEPSFLQRAVAPPGSGAVAVRLLLQRLPAGGWVQLPPVARVAPPGEPIANVSQGAEARPARDLLGPDTLAAMRSQTAQVACAIAAHPDGPWAVEAGVDFAVAADGQPHLLELNGRPQGRLASLAAADPEGWADAHIEACARPLRRLWTAEAAH